MDNGDDAVCLFLLQQQFPRCIKAASQKTQRGLESKSRLPLPQTRDEPSVKTSPSRSPSPRNPVAAVRDSIYVPSPKAECTSTPPVRGGFAEGDVQSCRGAGSGARAVR
ncbi:hypothetical protein GN956_G14357 [Arapaima gigas]